MLKSKTINIPQDVVYSLAMSWEPKASQSPQQYRFAHCVICNKKLFWGMWHVWLDRPDMKKEIHFCKKCGLWCDEVFNHGL